VESDRAEVSAVVEVVEVYLTAVDLLDAGLAEADFVDVYC
jgi:hypothetical protein